MVAMTGPNPDRVPLRIRRQKCETVRAMRDEGWDIIAKCDACGLVMRVDLALIMRVRGPALSLWNRRSRCRRLGCAGWMDFQGRAPGMGWHEMLRAE
jgi:hypothetical protein